MQNKQRYRGGTLRKNLNYYGLLRCLLQFITDITNFYFINYGAFTREFVSLKRLCQIGPENLTFRENRPKSGPFYHGYYGIFYNRKLRKITVRNVPPGTLGHFYLWQIYYC